MAHCIKLLSWLGWVGDMFLENGLLDLVQNSLFSVQTHESNCLFQVAELGLKHYNHRNQIVLDELMQLPLMCAQ